MSRQRVHADNAAKKRFNRLRLRAEAVAGNFLLSVLGQMYLSQGLNVAEVSALPWLNFEDYYRHSGSTKATKEFVEEILMLPYLEMDRSRTNKPLIRLRSGDSSKAERLQCARISRIADRSCERADLNYAKAILDQISYHFNNMPYTQPQLEQAIIELFKVGRHDGSGILVERTAPPNICTLNRIIAALNTEVHIALARVKDRLAVSEQRYAASI